MRFITIDEVATVVRGSSPRPQGDIRYYGGKVPRLMVSDVTRDGMYVTPKIDFLTQEGATKSRPMKKGDLIIAVSGDPGEPCILKVDACIHDGFVGFRNLDVSKVYTPYLYRFFKYNKLKSKSQAVGAIYKNLNTDQIKGIQIPLPPLPQQQKISNILDAADALRQNDKALIAKYDELTQALFLDMFGDIKANSKKWDLKPFEYFAKFDTRMTSDFVKYANHPHIGIANIEKETGKLIDYKLISEENLSSGKYIFDKSHIIYSKIRPNLNKVALPNFSGLCSADSYPLKVINENANRIFFAYVLRSESFVDFILTHSTRTNIPKANKEQMKKYIGIAPPINLQNQFAESILLIEEQKAIAQKSLEHSESLFNSLLQKAFKGEL